VRRRVERRVYRVNAAIESTARSAVAIARGYR
jgi:hypothetical protein